MNLQYETLKALSKITLPENMEKVVISFSKDVSTSGAEHSIYRFSNKALEDFNIKMNTKYSENYVKEYILENGIEISFSVFDDGSNSFVFKDGTIKSFGKWKNEDFFKLKYLFSFDDSPATDETKTLFDLYSKIYMAFFNVQQMFVNGIQYHKHGDKEDMAILKIVNYGNFGTPVYNYSLIRKTPSVHGFYEFERTSLSSYNSFTYMVEDFTKDFLNSTASLSVLETNGENKVYDDYPQINFRLNSLSSMVLSLLKNLDIEWVDLNGVDSDEAIIHYHPNTYRYNRLLQRAYGVISKGIPITVVNEMFDGDEIRTCDITGNFIMQNSTNLLDFNTTRGYGNLAISHLVFEEHQEEHRCDSCGRYHTRPSIDLMHTAFETLSEEKIENFATYINHHYDYEIDTGDLDDFLDNYDEDDKCPRCREEEAELNRALDRIGCTMRNGRIISPSGREVYIRPSGISDYDYTPDFDFFDTPEDTGPTNLYMGVELEIDGGGENNKNADLLCSLIDSNFMYAMHDGSLDDGFEMATMPGTLLFHQSLEENYKEAFEVAKQLDYRSHDTDSCGLHVHINKNFFGNSRSVQNIKAAFMALILERNWDDIVRFSRRNYHSIEEWACKKDLMDDVYDDESDEQIARKFRNKYDDDKYVALNTSHSNSFELRIFKGTLKYNTYIATLQFVSNLANLAKDCTSLSKVQQITFEDIVEYKEYDELTRYLKERNMTQTD